VSGDKRGDGNVVEQRVAQVAIGPQLRGRLVGGCAEPTHSRCAGQMRHGGHWRQYVDVPDDAGHQLDGGRQARLAEHGHGAVGRRSQIARPAFETDGIQRAIVAGHVDRRGPAHGSGATRRIAGRRFVHAV
jgi:hypothetical protein